MIYWITWTWDRIKRTSNVLYREKNLSLSIIKAVTFINTTFRTVQKGLKDLLWTVPNAVSYKSVLGKDNEGKF